MCVHLPTEKVHSQQIIKEALIPSQEDEAGKCLLVEGSQHWKSNEKVTWDMKS